MMLMWGTLLVLTALTNCAPFLMRPALSAWSPTMKPATLWRKQIGVRLVGVVSKYVDGVDLGELVLLLVAKFDEMRGLV
jgi:hypothetical protein